MKKFISLTKAVMSEGLGILRFKAKNNPKSKLLLFILLIYVVFAVYMQAYNIFESISKYNLVSLALLLIMFLISVFIVVEGIYKSGPLLFKCKDDDLLFSLPVKKVTVLLVRLLKFFIYEFVLNALIVIPILVAYARFEAISVSFVVTNIFALILLPMVPMSIALILGFVISYISSKIRFKNLAQVLLSAGVLIGIYYAMLKIDYIKDYIINNSNSINDIINKIYYPLGLYLNLITDFKILDLFKYIGINLLIYGITVFLLSKIYFKISSDIKEVSHKSKHNNKYIIKVNKPIISLIKKEILTFFKTPVLLLNAGFSLAIYLVFAIYLFVKLDDLMVALASLAGLIGTKVNLITDNLSVGILIILGITSFTSSISSSLISLEGKTINILKTIPIKTSSILLSKVLACLLITSPILLLGDILIFIKLDLSVIEMILLTTLTILIPMVSHFIGILVNLKMPKLDFENAAEVVKQSGAVLVSTLIGLGLAIAIFNLNVSLVTLTTISKEEILIINTLIMTLINSLLFLAFKGIGTKLFNKLSV